MRLQILRILLIQVVLVESLEGATGYLGENVTLPSNGSSSWRLSKIKWSIFLNSTWIATYQDGKENTNRLPRYKGRLSLNVSTGDLTIHNLTKDDAMEYTVDLINTEKKSIVNKIKLEVTQHLQKPTIKTLFNSSAEEGCWIGLHCISASEDVVFSWHVNSSNVTIFNMSHPQVKPGLYSAFFYKKQIPVQITCISSRNKENASRVVTPECNDGKPQTQHQHQSTCGLYVFLGIFLGVVAVVIIYVCKGERKTSFFLGKFSRLPSLFQRNLS
ncbi:uncharacterized protein si:cabz01074946.1 isoform X1 [Thunnus albacares]|uniref:uncharacterized protein si:cabz01074946.1 isoform X1 n=1 Tax=Thunnus albacares TaxID=8236 RepID=UPI001CF6A95F|nr:uncharacterized protein si:cabz01074946.1 isoform X1 [Thunnus albacares]